MLTFCQEEVPLFLINMLNDETIIYPHICKVWNTKFLCFKTCYFFTRELFSVSFDSGVFCSFLTESPVIVKVEIYF